MTIIRPTFDQTVSTLVKAFMNNTLEIGNYCACAIGNLIAEKVNAKIVLKPGWLPEYTGSRYEWDHPKFTGEEWYATRPTIRSSVCREILVAGRKMIDLIGYTLEEIWLIEGAFEGCRYKHKDYEDQMFNGLMAVVDVLADIHKIDLSQKEEAKKLFLKPEAMTG